MAIGKFILNKVTKGLVLHLINPKDSKKTNKYLFKADILTFFHATFVTVLSFIKIMEGSVFDEMGLENDN